MCTLSRNYKVHHKELFALIKKRGTIYVTRCNMVSLWNMTATVLCTSAQNKCCFANQTSHFFSLNVCSLAVWQIYSSCCKNMYYHTRNLFNDGSSLLVLVIVRYKRLPLKLGSLDYFLWLGFYFFLTWTGVIPLLKVNCHSN